MAITQNYELIDKAKLSPQVYIKICRLGTEEGQEHYSVSWFYNYKNKKDFLVNELIACDHFLGASAEIEALSNFLGYAEPNDFEVTPAKRLSSCRQERSYRDLEVIKKLSLESLLLD